MFENRKVSSYQYKNDMRDMTETIDALKKRIEILERETKITTPDITEFFSIPFVGISGKVPKRLPIGEIVQMVIGHLGVEISEQPALKEKLVLTVMTNKK